MNKKEDIVFAALKLAPDWTARPFSSMKAMKQLRNTFAHAKPQAFEMDEVVEAEVGELDGKRYDIGPKWEKDCMPEPVLAAYDDLKEVWKAMFEASGPDRLSNNGPWHRRHHLHWRCRAGVPIINAV
ncbi:hypothetical protein [Bradyrhizobium genomosp. III]|uniref:hypothetical protein n=1 Tax=Bradyrhizobium genomosp. III TaxID=2683271 RepID=UPI0004B9CB11|nr:hypothetical protein [Bradyrhizobium sp. CCBAU 15615]